MNVFESTGDALKTVVDTPNIAASTVGLGAQLARLIYNALNKNMIVPTQNETLLGFDGITVDMFLEEQHTHKLTITQHPVEALTPITDHAYMEPAQIKMTCVFYSSVLSEIKNVWDNLSAIERFTDITSFENKLQRIYRELRELQTTRTLVTIKTSKFNDMTKSFLLETLEVPVNAQNFNILETHLTFKEVIIVKTEKTIVPEHRILNKVSVTPDEKAKKLAQLQEQLEFFNNLIPTGV